MVVKKTLKEKYFHLEKRLQEAKEEVEYYKILAENAGKKRLREIEELSKLIRDCKKVEESLRENERKFRTLFDLSPQAIALTEVKTDRLIDVNRKYCELTKYAREEILGLSITELGFCSDEDRQRFKNEIQATGEVRGLEINLKAKDGSNLNTITFSRTIIISGEEYILTILLDVTEKKRLEAQLRQAHKIEAIGTLAGGIAHDFNNLLMAIQGNTSLMILDLDTAHPHYEMLKSIEKQIQSGAKLTSQLLGYARKGKYETKSINLNQLVEETSNAFGRARKEITVHRELAEDLFLAEMDQGQIEQVLLNLYVNAADAMSDGGNIILKTMNVNNEHMMNGMYKLKPGKYVNLQVTDTGTGMDEKTKQRVFEPFFTTKEMGRGTGLGLASVYGIIKGHNGYIDIDSEEGKGTTFNIYLPASDKMVRIDTASNREVFPGKAVLLVVDDEKMVLEVCSNMLKKAGFTVFEAGNGSDAIEIFMEHNGSIDLVILDMVMPEMGGGEVYDRMKEINPNVKVLLSSGYSIDGQAAEILRRGCDGFIQKPFNISKITSKIRKILQ